jgi:hypothetical protein
VKSRALVLAATALAGALAVVALQLTRGASTEAVGGAREMASAPGVRSAELEGNSNSASASAESMRSAPTPNASTSSARESTAQVERVRIVRIVDAASGNPVDGARIAYFELEPGAESDGHPGWNLDSGDAWLAEHGRTTACGRDGLAPLIANPDRACIVVASHKELHGGLYGRRTLPAHDPSTLAVALVRDFTLEVKVVGATGEPVSDAPVVLRTPEGSRFVEHAERVTDANGGARFAHLVLQAPELGLPLHVAVKGLLGESAEAALDRRAPPTAPLELRLPAFGGLDVRAMGIEGDPGTLPERVEVRYDDQPADLDTLWRSGPSVGAPLENGVARFRHLRVGADLIVSAKLKDSKEETRVRTRGPGFQGEVVPVELKLAANGALLRVRLFDPAGQPLAERAVTTRVDTRFDSHTWTVEAQHTSDAAGSVAVWIGAVARAAETRSLLVTETGPHGGPFRSGTLALRAALPSGCLDGGDLTLTELPVLVGGRVVDSDGIPIAGAKILAAVEMPGGEPGQFETLDISLATDATGAFTLRGSSPTATVRVRALHGERRSNAVERPRGAADVVLTVWTGGAIAGRVLIDADVPIDALAAFVYPSELVDPLVDALSSTTKFDPDGRFRTGGLLPGRYSFGFTGWTAGRGLGEIRDIAVRSGETTADPRLAALDLRGRCSVLRVELLPPKPGAALRGQLSLRASEPVKSSAKPHRHEIQGPAFTLVVPWPASDITFDVLGYRRVELRGVRGEQRVELVPAPRLRLRIPADVELPSPPSYLKVHLSPSGYESMTQPHQLETAFGPSREVEFRSPHLGQLEVHWYVEKRSPNWIQTARLTENSPRRIEVLDLAGDQIFELVVPVELLAPHLGR